MDCIELMGWQRVRHTEQLSLHFMYLLRCFDVLTAISSGYYISEHSIG